jgi:hypothetical protein
MWTLIVGLFVVVAVGGWFMLNAIAGRGGERDGDAAEAATKTLNQIDAFRVKREGREAWDGHEHYPRAQGNDGGT